MSVTLAAVRGSRFSIPDRSGGSTVTADMTQVTTSQIMRTMRWRPCRQALLPVRNSPGWPRGT
jgi:hypothetical protein